VSVNDDALRAEIEALRAQNHAFLAENDALRAQIDPAKRTWTASEISAMDHRTYLDHEREVLAALREGRVRRDDAAAAGHDGPSAGPADDRGPGRA
jgi:hypothetical protein